MDTLDKKILECLQKNARQSASDIGKTIHLSVSTVIDRIRKLEASGIIQHITAVLERKSLERCDCPDGSEPGASQVLRSLHQCGCFQLFHHGLLLSGG